MRDQYSKTGLRLMKAASTCCKAIEFLVNGLKDKLPVPVCISGFFFSCAFNNVDAN